jgi:hypothetical protein
MQYTSLDQLVEMLPQRGGKMRAVSGLSFSCDNKILATAGASMAVRLFDYDSVLDQGTWCEFSGVRRASGSCLVCPLSTPLRTP